MEENRRCWFSDILNMQKTNWYQFCWLLTNTFHLWFRYFLRDLLCILIFCKLWPLPMFSVGNRVNLCFSCTYYRSHLMRVSYHYMHVWVSFDVINVIFFHNVFSFSPAARLTSGLSFFNCIPLYTISDCDRLQVWNFTWNTVIDPLALVSRATRREGSAAMHDCLVFSCNQSGKLDTMNSCCWYFLIDWLCVNLTWIIRIFRLHLCPVKVNNDLNPSADLMYS